MTPTDLGPLAFSTEETVRIYQLVLDAGKDLATKELNRILSEKLAKAPAIVYDNKSARLVCIEELKKYE